MTTRNFFELLALTTLLIGLVMSIGFFSYRINEDACLETAKVMGKTPYFSFKAGCLVLTKKGYVDIDHFWITE